MYPPKKTTPPAPPLMSMSKEVKQAISNLGGNADEYEQRLRKTLASSNPEEVRNALVAYGQFIDTHTDLKTPSYTALVAPGTQLNLADSLKLSYVNDFANSVTNQFVMSKKGLKDLADTAAYWTGITDNLEAALNANKEIAKLQTLSITSKGGKSIFEDFNPNSFAATMGQGIGQVAAALAPMAVGALVGGPIGMGVGRGASFLVSTAQMYGQLMDDFRAKGISASDASMYAAPLSAILGVAEVAIPFEALLEKATKPLVANAVLDPIVSSIAKNGITKEVMGEIEKSVFLNNKQFLKAKAGAVAGAMASQAAVEGAEEFFQGYIEDIGKKIYDGINNDTKFKDIDLMSGKNFVEHFQDGVIGAMIGGTLASGTVAKRLHNQTLYPYLDRGFQKGDIDTRIQNLKNHADFLVQKGKLPEDKRNEFVQDVEDVANLVQQVRGWVSPTTNPETRFNLFQLNRFRQDYINTANQISSSTEQAKQQSVNLNPFEKGKVGRMITENDKMLQFLNEATSFIDQELADLGAGVRQFDRNVFNIGLQSIYDQYNPPQQASQASTSVSNVPNPSQAQNATQATASTASPSSQPQPRAANAQGNTTASALAVSPTQNPTQATPQQVQGSVEQEGVEVPVSDMDSVQQGGADDNTVQEQPLSTLERTIQEAQKRVEGEKSKKKEIDTFAKEIGSIEKEYPGFFTFAKQRLGIQTTNELAKLFSDDPDNTLPIIEEYKLSFDQKENEYRSSFNKVITNAEIYNSLTEKYKFHKRIPSDVAERISNTRKFVASQAENFGLVAKFTNEGVQLTNEKGEKPRRFPVYSDPNKFFKIEDLTVEEYEVYQSYIKPFFTDFFQYVTNRPGDTFVFDFGAESVTKNGSVLEGIQAAIEDIEKGVNTKRADGLLKFVRYSTSAGGVEVYQVKVGNDFKVVDIVPWDELAQKEAEDFIPNEEIELYNNFVLDFLSSNEWSEQDRELAIQAINEYIQANENFPLFNYKAYELDRAFGDSPIFTNMSPQALNALDALFGQMAAWQTEVEEYNQREFPPKDIIEYATEQRRDRQTVPTEEQATQQATRSNVSPNQEPQSSPTNANEDGQQEDDTIRPSENPTPSREEPTTPTREPRQKPVGGLSSEKRGALAKMQGVISPAPNNSYITFNDRTDWGKVVDEIGDFMVTVKDSYGNRASMPASAFGQLIESPLFSQLVSAVWVSDSDINSTPEIPDDFMVDIRKGGKFLPLEALALNDILLPEEIEFESRVYIPQEQAKKVIEGLNNADIQFLLRSLKVKKVILESPKNLQFSEQGNYNTKTKVLTLNGFASNPKQTLLHELAHERFENLGESEKDYLRSLVPPPSEREQYESNTDEYIVDNFYQQDKLSQYLQETKNDLPIQATETIATQQKPVISGDPRLTELQAKKAKLAEELAQALREQRGQLNAGIDPKVLSIGIQYVAVQAEIGVLKLAQIIDDFVAQIGMSDPDTIQALKGAYSAFRDTQATDEQLDQMDDTKTVRAYVYTETQTTANPNETTQTTPTLSQRNEVGGTLPSDTAPALPSDVGGQLPNFLAGAQGGDTGRTNEGVNTSGNESYPSDRDALGGVYDAAQRPDPRTDSRDAQQPEGDRVNFDARAAKYKLRYPEKNILVFASPKKLLQRLKQDAPSYDITNPENQIGNRVEQAKQFYKDYYGQEAEPSLPYIAYNKLGFEDGRHRILAAQELGIEEVAIEIPKEQEALFKQFEVAKEEERILPPPSPEQPVIQVKPRNNFVLPPDKQHPSTFSVAKKFDDNIAALETLVTLLEEDRQATPDEQTILANYIGFGGLSEIVQYKKPYSEAKSMYYSGNPQHEARVKRVYELTQKLDPDGKLDVWESLKASTTTSYFTPYQLVRGVYNAILKTGFSGGRILEPSMGIGNFFGVMPTQISQNSALHGVELDWISGKIAQKLYPDAYIQINRFEFATSPENYFDLNISNVPFGDIKAFEDPAWKGKKEAIFRSAPRRIHDYFAVKMIESTRPGGLIVLVTSKGTMDKQELAIRKYMSDKTEFLGALRLPNNTFKGNANTRVVTDLIFLKKKDQNSPSAQKHNFLELQADPKSGFTYNQYFVANPQNVLGTITKGGLYEREEDFTVEDDNNFTENIEKIISDRSAEFMNGVTYSPAQDTANQINKSSYEQYQRKEFERTGSIVIKDGKVGFVIPDGVSYEMPSRGKIEPKMAQNYINLRKAFMELIYGEINNLADETVERLRRTLNVAYAEFTKAHKFLGQNPRLKIDPDYYRLLALEKKDKDTGNITKADIFTKRTVKPNIRFEKALTPRDAILASLSESGVIVPSRMKELLGEDWFNQVGDQVFELPSGGYETKEVYLSGSVKKKLAEAKRAAEIDSRFQRNVEAMQEVQPQDIPAELIQTNLGSPWVPVDVYQNFATQLFGGEIDIVYTNATNYYEVKDPSYRTKNAPGFLQYNVASRHKSGGIGLSADELLHKILNNNQLTVTYYVDKKSYVDKDATAQAEAKATQIKMAFAQWLWSDPKRSDRLSKIYNNTFNSIVNRNYDGSFLTMPGYAGPSLRPHQKNALWMLLQNNGGLVDHGVGLGKTLVMITAAMEMRRLGIAKKPMIAAMKANVGQIAESFQAAYPAANLLFVTESEFSAKNRAALLNRIATNDWDCVIITHDQLKKIPNDAEIQKEIIYEEIADLEESIRFLKNDEGLQSKGELKKMESRKSNLEATLQSMLATEKDDTLTFQKMGIDHLFVDESQVFKNLRYATRLTGVAGLGKPAGSKSTEHLLTVARGLQKLHQADKGLTFLSGTPISNSISEMYLIQKYHRPTRLKELGLNTFDAWVNTFAEKSTELEFDATAKLKLKNRLRKFINLPELSSFYLEIADVKDVDAKDENGIPLVPKPEVKGGKPDFNLIKPSLNQERFMKALVAFASSPSQTTADNIGRSWSDGLKKAKMLVVTTAGAKAAIDIRLVNPNAPADSGSKITASANNIARIYQESNPYKGVQLVFSDLGTPKSGNFMENVEEYLLSEVGLPSEKVDSLLDGITASKVEELKLRLVEDEDLELDLETVEVMLNDVTEYTQNPDSFFNVYSELKKQLSKKHGIPEGEVAFIHDYKTAKSRDDLFERVKAGEIRVLIGSTSKLGTGVNVQKRVVALHHLDVVWRPSDYEQRNGRGLRQGNEVAEKYFDNTVQVLVYGTENSLDSLKFGLLYTKATAFRQVKVGANGARSLDEGNADGEFSLAEMAAAISGNPAIKEKAQADRLVDSLFAEQRGFLASQANNQRNYNAFKAEAERLLAKQPYVEQDVKAASEVGFFRKENSTDSNYALLEVNGRTEEKSDALGKALLNQMANVPVRGVLTTGREWFQYPIGRIGAFTIYASKFLKDSDRIDISISMNGGKTTYETTSALPKEQNPAALAVKIFAKLKDIDPDSITKNQEAAIRSQENTEAYGKQLGDVWPKEEELKQALEKQQRLASELDTISKAVDTQDNPDEFRLLDNQGQSIPFGKKRFGSTPQENEYQALIDVDGTILPETPGSNVQAQIANTQSEPKNSSSEVITLAQEIQSVFPNIILVTDPNEIDRIQRENPTEFVPITSQGQLLGFNFRGKVYVDPRVANKETAIHEFGHVWLDVAEKEFPAQLERGLALIKGTQYEQAVREQYPWLTDERKILKEALAQAIGEKGTKILDQTKFERFTQWLNRIWQNIKEMFGADVDLNMRLDDFITATAADLLSGNVISEMDSEQLSEIQDNPQAEQNNIEAEAKANGTWLKAPNGQPTKLTPAQWVTVRTKPFKDWFGDWENDPQNASKVVDENGEPLVVYHGSQSQFDTFDPNKKGSRGGLREEFFSFTSNPKVAQEYSKGDWSGNNKNGHTLEVFLNIRDMPKYDNEGKYYNELNVWAEYKWARIFDLQDWHSRGFLNFQKTDGFSVENTIEMEKPFYGEIPNKEEFIGDTFYVKNPNQIKSATANSGAFSPNNNSIQAQIKGRLKANYKQPFVGKKFTPEEAVLQLKEYQNAIDEAEAKISKAKQRRKVLKMRLSNLQGKATTNTQFVTSPQSSTATVDTALKKLIRLDALIKDVEAQLGQTKDVIQQGTLTIKDATTTIQTIKDTIKSSMITIDPDGKTYYTVVDAEYATTQMKKIEDERKVKQQEAGVLGKLHASFFTASKLNPFLRTFEPRVIADYLFPKDSTLHQVMAETVKKLSVKVGPMRVLAHDVMKQLTDKYQDICTYRGIASPDNMATKGLIEKVVLATPADAKAKEIKILNKRLNDLIEKKDELLADRKLTPQKEIDLDAKIQTVKDDINDETNVLATLQSASPDTPTVEIPHDYIITLVATYKTQMQEYGASSIVDGEGTLVQDWRNPERQIKVKLSEDEIARLENLVDTKYSDFLNTIQDYFAQILPLLQETYRNLEASELPLAKADFYFPIRYESELQEVTLESGASLARDAPFVRERKGISDEDLVVTQSVFELMNRYMRGAENYVQLMPSSQNFNLIKTLTTPYMKENGLMAYNKEIERMTKKFNNPMQDFEGGDKSIGVASFKKIIGLTTLSRFAFNVALPLKNMTGYSAALGQGIVDDKYIKENFGFVVRAFGNGYARLFSSIPKTIYNYKDPFNTNNPVSKEIEDTIADMYLNPDAGPILSRVLNEGLPDINTIEWATISAVSENNSVRTALRRYNQILGLIKENGLTAQQQADASVMLGFWKAATAHVKDNMANEPIDVQQKEIARLANDLMYATNATYDLTDKSSIQLDGRWWTKMIILYQSQGFKVFNTMIKSVNDFVMNPTAENKKIMMANVRHTMIYAPIYITFVNIMAAGLRAFGDEEKEEKIFTSENIGWEFAGQLSQILPLANVGTEFFVSAIDNRPWDSPMAQLDPLEPINKGMQGFLEATMTSMQEFETEKDQKEADRKIRKGIMAAVTELPTALGMPREMLRIVNKYTVSPLLEDE